MTAAVVYGCILFVKGRSDFISSWYKLQEDCSTHIVRQHISKTRNCDESWKSLKSQKVLFWFLPTIVPDTSPLVALYNVSVLFLKKDSVEESLTCLFPAAGGAPLVSVFNAVHLPAFLGFAPNPPVSMK